MEISIELIDYAAKLIFVPLIGVLWQMNSRLSRIEGQLEIKLKDDK